VGLWKVPEDQEAIKKLALECVQDDPRKRPGDFAKICKTLLVDPSTPENVLLFSWYKYYPLLRSNPNFTRIS
jgi:hypothetical protein